MTNAIAKEPSLRIVKSFNRLSYPYPVKISIEYDPEKSAADNRLRDNPDYREFKLQNLPGIKSRGIKNILRHIGMNDYYIFQNGTNIELHFKTSQERGMAIAAFAPERPYTMDLVECEPAASFRKMKRIAHEIRKDFGSMASGKKIRFKIDRQKNIVRAYAKNGWDFIQFMRDYSALEASFNASTPQP